MGAVEMTMDVRQAAIMASLNESRALLASCARRLGVKGPEGPVATAPSLATTSMLMFGQDRVPEKTVTKPWSSSLISTHRGSAVGDLNEDTVLAPARPTRCSTNCLASNVGNNHAAVAIPASGMAHLPSTASTTPLSATPTTASLGERGMRMDELSRESPLAMAAALPAAPLLLTDQVVAVGALQVEDNLTTVTHIKGSTIGLGVDGNIQMSTFPREATLCASLATVVPNGELKHYVEPFPKEDYGTVITHIGGMSLFLEFDIGPGEEIVYKDMMSDEDIGDSVLTNVGGLSVFLEQPMNSLEEPKGVTDTSIVLDHAAPRVQLVYLLLPPQEVNKSDFLTLPWDPSTQGDVTHDPIFLLTYATNSVKLSLPWDPGKQGVTYNCPKEYTRLVSLWAPMKWMKTVFADSLGKAGGGSVPCLQITLKCKLFAQWDPRKHIRCWLMLSQYFQNYLQSNFGPELFAQWCFTRRDVHSVSRAPLLLPRTKLVLVLTVSPGNAFYLPGSYMYTHFPGEDIWAKVNSLTSFETKMMFSYYSLLYRRSSCTIKKSAMNLGLKEHDAKLLKQRSNDPYQVNMMLDNLSVMCFSEQNIVTLQLTCFPLGYTLAGSADDYSLNHLKFELLVHEYKDRNVEIISTGEQEFTVILEMDNLGEPTDDYVGRSRNAQPRLGVKPRFKGRKV